MLIKARVKELITLTQSGRPEIHLSPESVQLAEQVITGSGGIPPAKRVEKNSGDTAPPRHPEPAAIPPAQNRPGTGTPRGRDKKPIGAPVGVVVLKSMKPLPAEASVFVDGNYFDTWKVGASEKRVTLPAGDHTIIIRENSGRTPKVLLDAAVKVLPERETIKMVGPGSRF